MATKAGEIVKALCSECKVPRDSEITAAVGTEIVSVTCRTCGSTQPYASAESRGGGGGGRRVVDVGPRPKKRTRGRTRRAESDSSGPARKSTVGALEASRSGVRTPTARHDDPLFQRWDAETDAVDSRHARPHRTHENYVAGEAVLHKVYGMGIVDEVDAEGDLKVLFKMGFVTLPSGRRRGEGT